MAVSPLIRIVNSLEGYRVSLQENKILSNDDKSCLEMLMHTTIVTAKEHGFEVQPYERWFTNYIKVKNKENDNRQLSLVFGYE